MASVLETFYILFKSNADEVEEGAKKSGDAVDKLEKDISRADKGSVQMGKSFNHLATQAVAAFASVFAVTQLIASAKGIASQATELNALGKILDESESDIVNWGRAVETVGGNSKTFENTLRGLNASLNNALLTGPNDASRALGMMGIAVLDANNHLKSTLTLLPEIAGEFGEMTRVDAQKLGSMLGLDESTILLLMRGEEQVRKIVAEKRRLNTVTDAERGDIHDMNIAWQEFSQSLENSSQKILHEALPAIDELRKGALGFSSFLDDHIDDVGAFFEGIVAGAELAKQGISLLTQEVENYGTEQDSILNRAVRRWLLVADAIMLVQEGIQLFETNLANAKAAFSLDAFGTDSGGVLKGVLNILDDIDEAYRDIKGLDIEKGQSLLQDMETAFIEILGGTVSSVPSNQGGGRTTSVHIDEINISTQATDAQTIAADISRELSTQINQAIDANDDGVAA